MTSNTSDSRKMREQSTVEVRRARGEISCAECRRLKLKCDKTIPCSSCVRRGCAELCPNRAQTTVHGSKQATAEIDRLRSKIKTTSKRIRQLEDALAAAHASSSLSPHPLLNAPSPDLDGGTPDAASDHADSDAEADENAESDSAKVLDSNILNAFSELAITDCKTNLGDGLGEADELLNIIRQDASHLEGSPAESGRYQLADLPAEIAYLSRDFPFSPFLVSADKLQDTIISLLPQYERATALVEAYLENLSWFFRPVGREQIMEELMPAAYKNRRRTAGTNGFNCIDPHELSVLLAVFALGAVSDLTLMPTNNEGELYYHCCRAALNLKSVFDRTSLACVQAISIIANYDMFSCRSSTLDGSFKLMGLSNSLALQLGLHRDPAHGKFSEKIIQRRRMLFWELYGMDTCNSLSSGRPTIFRQPIVECRFPDDPWETTKADGSTLPSVWLWRARFVKEVIAEVVDTLASARNLKYSEILALDRKIRLFDLADALRQSALLVNPAAAEGGVMWYLQQYADVVIKGNTLSLLHRNFFARAILENPENPAQTAFGPSFLAAYRASVVTLRVLREHFDALAHLLLRVWPVWAHSLANCVILGSVAALGSRSSLAPEAFVEFDKAIGMFAKAQMHPVAKSGLPILLRLRNRAFRALTNDKNGVTGLLSSSGEFDIDDLVPEQPQTTEFNVVNAMGRIYRRSAKGEFGVQPAAAQAFMNNYVVADASASAQYSQGSARHSPFVSSAYTDFGPVSIVDASPNLSQSTGPNVGFSAFSTSGPTGQLPSSNGFLPDQLEQLGLLSDSIYNPSPFRSPPSSQLPKSTGTFCTSSSHVHTPSSDSKSGETSEIGSGPDASPAASEGAAASHYTPSGESATSISAASPFSGFRKSSLDGLQEGVGDSSRSGAQPMVLDPAADFDVSHDLRLATGEEDPLAILPQDMEAWRALLEDPRMMTGFR